MKKTLFLLLLLNAKAAETPTKLAETPPTNAVAQVVREVVTNYNSIGHLRLHSGTNYDVLQPRIFTNVIARATYNGKISEIVLESNGGPIDTNWCNFKLLQVDMPPNPPFMQRQKE